MTDITEAERQVWRDLDAQLAEAAAWLRAEVHWVLDAYEHRVHADARYSKRAAGAADCCEEARKAITRLLAENEELHAQIERFPYGDSDED